MGGRRVLHAAAAVAVAFGALTTLAGRAFAAQAPQAREAAADRPADRPRLGFAVPKRIRIPSIGLKAKLVKVDVDRHGYVEVPPYRRRHVAGWFDRSSSPGEAGAAVIVGHVDTKTGPSVFFRLKQVRQGDKILVDRKDHVTVVFRVNKIKRVAKARFPSKKVYGDVSYPALRVITCGGVFSRKSGHYLDNVIVFARLTRVIDHGHHHRHHEHTDRAFGHRTHHGWDYAPDGAWDDRADRRHDERPSRPDEVRDDGLADHAGVVPDGASPDHSADHSESSEIPDRRDEFPDVLVGGPDTPEGVDWATIGDGIRDWPSAPTGARFPT